MLKYIICNIGLLHRGIKVWRTVSLPNNFADMRRVNRLTVCSTVFC